MSANAVSMKAISVQIHIHIQPEKKTQPTKMYELHDLFGPIHRNILYRMCNRIHSVNLMALLSYSCYASSFESLSGLDENNEKKCFCQFSDDLNHSKFIEDPIPGYPITAQTLLEINLL